MSVFFLFGIQKELEKTIESHTHTSQPPVLTLTHPPIHPHHHNADNKSISIGRFIQESFTDNQYAMHNCSTLAGSSGTAILDAEGRFIGIHIGVSNSRITKKNKCFYAGDIFNKFIPVYSTPFNTFIHETLYQISIMNN